jgi:hypothetical protein
MSPTMTPHASAAADPLAALRGIHLPEPVGLWPLAPGWWIALFLLATAAIAAAVLLRRRRTSLVRRALGELDALASRAADLQSLASGVSELLRRVALVRFGGGVARLHGPAWPQFLATHAPRSRRDRWRTALADDVGRAIALAPYAPPGAMSLGTGESRVDRDALLGAARAWIRGNR